MLGQEFENKTNALARRGSRGAHVFVCVQTLQARTVRCATRFKGQNIFRRMKTGMFGCTYEGPKQLDETHENDEPVPDRTLHPCVHLALD